MYIQGTRVITDADGKATIKEIHKRYNFPCEMQNGKPVRRKRGKREKPTAAAVRRYNAIRAQRKLIRKINANFQKGDLYLTLTYPAGCRPGRKQAEKDVTNFIKALRRRFRANGRELKWIARTELGEQGAIHHHVIVPKTDAQAVETVWNRIGGGHVHFRSMYGHDFSLLATYFCKPEPENAAQLTLLPEEEKVRLNYRCSRNLFEPQEYKKTCKANSWRNEPFVPAGWYLDKNSYVQGINPITGHGYQYYRLIRLE